MQTELIEKSLVRLVRQAGAVLLNHFGGNVHPRHKESTASVVCDADLAAEQVILKRLRADFPQDSIITEESERIRGSSAYTWVIDPLDGTSNFVAGIPWFGTQVGLLRQGRPIAAAIGLPTQKLVYYARAGAGVFRNGVRVRVTAETALKNTLCAFGLDAYAGERRSRQNAGLLWRVACGVRNIRATNSLVDFCYTVEGRLGGCVNLHTKIWDIVPVSVMLPEAGGKFTDLDGREIVFDLSDKASSRSYAVMGASRALYPQLLRLVRGTG